jgi:NAD(P)-dependent dehydrogenase (short-subunit alcohol dehydrogenase family)
MENRVNAAVRSGSAIVVTGAASGIGEACAEPFVERGATVVLFDRGRSALEATAERLGMRHWACDVSDEISVHNAVHAMLDEEITPAGLLHSAGITQPTAGPEDVTVADFSHVVSIDLAPWGVKANAVLPGIVAGQRFEGSMELHAKLEGITKEQALDRIMSRTKLKRFIQPDEIAAAVSYFSSDDAVGITGTSWMSLAVSNNVHTAGNARSSTHSNVKGAMGGGSRRALGYPGDIRSWSASSSRAPWRAAHLRRIGLAVDRSQVRGNASRRVLLPHDMSVRPSCMQLSSGASTSQLLSMRSTCCRWGHPRSGSWWVPAASAIRI